MALTLTIADAADGTGGSAVVAGADPATTVSLYRAAFAGAAGPLSWSLVGTRTGSGSIAIASPSPVPLGFYQWHAVGTSGSAPAFASYFRALTDATAKAVQQRVHEAVVQQIRTLSLQDVLDVRVVDKWLPRKIQPSVDPLPQIQVTALNDVNFPGMLSGRDDVGYPVAIIFLDKQDQDYVKNKPRNLLWLERVSKIFRFQRLSGVSESLYAEPEQWTNINWDLFNENNLYFGMLGFRFLSRETRGAS